MFIKESAGLIAALVLISTVGVERANAAEQKTAKAPQTSTKSPQTSTKSTASTKRHHARHSRAIRHGKSYLVPPPPPYSPSILPELVYARSHGKLKKKQEVSEDTEKTAENQAPKTIWSRDGYQDPEPVQPNKYVTYWNKN